MDIIFILISIAFFIWIIRNSLFWVYLWQLKEYRFDRLYVHLKETNAGRKIIFSYFSIFKWIVFLAFLPVSFNIDYLFIYRLFILFIFATEAVLVFKEFLSHRLHRPVITLKALLIILPTLFFISLLYLLPLTEQFLWLLFLDRLVFLFVALFVFIFWLPTEFYSDIKVEKAVEKILSRKDLLVIGVTGSYGKSTTKEYIAQILSKKFTVLKTKGTNNTLIGIANTILSGLRKDTEIFVVEMGAYKRGEIAKICSVVNPKIGIITGVGDQHLSLFGRAKNILEAKYELVESLPKNGLALFNGNSVNAYELYKKTKKKKILYQVLNNISVVRLTNDIYAYDVSFKKDSVSFQVVLKDKIIRMRAPVIGRQNVENILPGIYLANYLGIKDKKIKSTVGSLVSLPKTMTKHKVKNGLTLIDDTFNASLESVNSALSYMKLYEGIRIMILSPIIELGSEGKRRHFEAGCEIGKICDYLFLTNNNFSKDIIDGIRNCRGRCKLYVGNLKKITNFIKLYMDKKVCSNDIILFEGKESGIILDKVL